MFQFPALAPYKCKVISLQDIGLSHSEIHGSKVICTSPWLFAAYHVLHRLREPRHPPCALIYFHYHVHALYFIQSGWYILLALLVLTNFLLFQLVTSCQRSFVWRITDSNRWPPACKAGALASWANPPCCCLFKSGCKGKCFILNSQIKKQLFFIIFSFSFAVWKHWLSSM